MELARQDFMEMLSWEHPLTVDDAPVHQLMRIITFRQRANCAIPISNIRMKLPAITVCSRSKTMILFALPVQKDLLGITAKGKSEIFPIEE